MPGNLTRKKRAAPKLIVAIDIGTTYSAASYCIMPNQNTPPVFQEVNRWPKQISADAKISSVIYYDEKGKAQLHGAETEDEESIYNAEQSNWGKAEWWKLCLRPDYIPLPASSRPVILPALPPGITVDQVFCDQLAYINDSIRSFIVKSHLTGPQYWDELSKSMEVILTTPNGWEGKDQQRMREAAIKARLVGPDEGSRVKFVSEGEAAIHYCLAFPTITNQVKHGNTIVICDAGGGTIDIGVYRINVISPISLEEVSAPQCHIGGGALVTVNAGQFIQDRLRGSYWDTPEYLWSAIKTFDRQLKRQFNGSQSRCYLPLDGSTRSDAPRSISRGRLIISRNEMVSFFAPSLNTVKEGLSASISGMETPPDYIFLVGGFAESEYVFSDLQQWAADNGLQIAKPDDILSKAIAHGALSWYRNSAVQIRIAKMHYGAETDLLYSAKDMEGREKFQNVLGEWRTRGGWSSIVRKGSRLRSGQEHSSSFHHEFGPKDELILKMELYAYRWADPPPFFTSRDGQLIEGFIHLGTIKADLQECFNGKNWMIAPSGKPYKKLSYEVCLIFDEIEIKAQLKWRENSKMKRSEAVIVYDI